jgi:hypothetical protein
MLVELIALYISSFKLTPKRTAIASVWFFVLGDEAVLMTRPKCIVVVER